MIDERLSPNFWLSEFLHSDTAVRRGLDNTPGDPELSNIRTMLAPGMQSVRDCLGMGVFVTSGYRSPSVNAAVRGSKASQHMAGLAADFVCPSFGSPLTVARHIVTHCTQVRFDQLIQEGSWVHISFSAKPRGEVLTAHFGPNGVTYTHGLERRKN